MGRTKFRRIQEVHTFPNVATDPVAMRTVTGPFVLEVGCGAGEYTLALAARYPKKTFVGVDQKADRIWRAARAGASAGFENVFFINDYVQNLDEYFQSGDVEEIWITFPDPFPKPSKSGKRLTSSRFLALYRKILKPSGVIHFKTDNVELFDFTLGVLAEEGIEPDELVRDVHGQSAVSEILQVKTHYEEKFEAKGHKIYYVRWSL